MNCESRESIETSLNATEGQKAWKYFPFLAFANQLDILESAVFFKKLLDAKGKELKKLHKKQKSLILY